MEPHCDKPPIKIYGNDSLSTRVAAFQKKAEDHGHKQKANPFTQGLAGAHGHKQKANPFTQGLAGAHRTTFDKSDPRYGRPAEGSKTEKRGLAAGKHIENEVLFLCEMIAEYGVPLEDDTSVISFGEIFQIYVPISNKVVGILLRARKHGIVHFEGEILYQRRDDDVPITLLKSMRELREIFGMKPPVKRKMEEGESSAIAPEDY